MKYIIQEKFTGYNDIYIEAKSKYEAMRKYKLGNYEYKDVDTDDMTYNHEFDSIRKEEDANADIEKALDDINYFKTIKQIKDNE